MNNAPATVPSLTPTAPEERILTLDVLRGFAMFGVLWSNLNDWYGATAPTTRVDSLLRSVQSTLISGRFYTLLGFLFGVGFALQILRAEARGTNVVKPYVRRLLALMVIGWVHGLLIWRGDILATYATLGFALLLYRGLSPRGLLIAACLTFLVLPPVRGAILADFHLVPVYGINWATASYVYAHGSLEQAFRMHVRDFWDGFSGILLSTFPNFLTLFVLGLWLGRIGFVRRLPENLPVIRKALAIATVLAIVGVYVVRHFAMWWPPPPDPAMSLSQFARLLPRYETALIVEQLPIWAMAAAYACVLTLLVHREGWSRRLAPLAATGRMPLTTYLTQSIVCTLLFYRYGLGWFGRVSYTGMLAIALVLFSLQMVASVWWLRRFRFGPMEWLWRALSYGAAPPMH